MRILGALLAGGESRRFGSDKALAQHEGQNLIDHAIALLERQCDDIIICGRRYADYQHIMDRPMKIGPLGAFNAALYYAQNNDYDAVITFPCDTIKRDTIKRGTIKRGTIKRDTINLDIPWFVHGNQAQYMESQAVIGYWPSNLSSKLDDWLGHQKKHSVMGWAEHCGAAPISAISEFQNINILSDLIES